MPSLIDNAGSIPYSATKSYQTVLMQSKMSAWTIECVKDTLIAAGWTLLNTMPATATIAYPTGFPAFTGVASGVVGCGGSALIITTQTTTARYCPYPPGATPLPDGCQMFELGTTPLVSLTNLCGAINTTPNIPYSAAVTDTPELTITLTATTPGPFSNFDTVQADGRFGVTSGTILGGGYLLESTGASAYQFAVYGQIGVGEDGIQFDFTIGGGLVSYYLGVNGVLQYCCAANPCSFALFDVLTAPLHSIAAFAPDVIVPEGFTSTYCVFVLGPNVLTNQLMWKGGPRGEPCSIALGANAPITLGDALRGPGVLVPRVGAYEATTLNKEPLVTAAYAMMSDSYTSAPGVVGKLWDCLVVTKTLALGGVIQFANRNFVVIASQDGTFGYTPASLLFCIADNGQPD